MDKLICKTHFGEIYISIFKNRLMIKKINYDNKNFIAVKRFYSRFDSKQIATIYELCEDGKTMYMEYLDGGKLSDCSSFEVRVKDAVDFFNNWIPTLFTVNLEGEYKEIFYYDDLKKIINICDEKKLIESGIMDLFKCYKRILDKIDFSKNYLLHGDIHSRNLIYSANSVLKAIDISPIIAPLDFEYTKFFENELFMAETDEEFLYMIYYLLESFGLDKQTFVKCLFVDSCYRMLDTLFLEQDWSEINRIRMLNFRIWKEFIYGMEL